MISARMVSSILEELEQQGCRKAYCEIAGGEVWALTQLPNELVEVWKFSMGG